MHGAWGMLWVKNLTANSHELAHLQGQGQDLLLWVIALHSTGCMARGWARARSAAQSEPL